MLTLLVKSCEHGVCLVCVAFRCGDWILATSVSEMLVVLGSKEDRTREVGFERHLVGVTEDRTLTDERCCGEEDVIGPEKCEQGCVKCVEKTLTMSFDTICIYW